MDCITAFPACNLASEHCTSSRNLSLTRLGISNHWSCSDWRKNVRTEQGRSLVAVGVTTAGSLRGRFPQTPLQAYTDQPTWLQVARQKRQAEGKVEKFRKLLQDREAEEVEAAGLKTLKDRVGGRESQLDSAWYVMELSIHSTYSKAYELEAQGLGFSPTGIKSVFLVPPGHDIEVIAEIWRCMSGLRFVMEPLVVANGPEELVCSIRNLELGHNIKDFCLSHDKLCPSANRICRKELRAEVVAAIGNADYCPFSARWAPDKPRFAVIEIATGYIFGHVVYAPGPLFPNYRDAPHRWSAGIPASLAGIAVNIAGCAGDKLVDPCCGLGTILFEAQRRGFKTQGSDLSPRTLVNTCSNLSHFGVSYSKSWGEFCSIHGPHNPRSRASSGHLSSPWSPVGSDVPTPAPSRDCDTLQQEASNPQLVQLSTAASCSRKGLDETLDDVTCSEQQSCTQDCISIGSAVQEQSLESVAVSLAVQDARSVQFQADCVVSNLPFGRFLKLDEGVIESILLNLVGQAKRYVFFSGVPLTPTLRCTGYHVLREISVCPQDKRFMSICTSRTP